MDLNEKIIELVSNRDVLWNSSNRNYKNNKITAKEWQSIANKLNMQVDTVKKKWRNLRDNYARALLKRDISGQVEDDDDGCMGKYSAQLQFLRPHLRHRHDSRSHVIEVMDENDQIIELVSERDVLWNLSHKNYNNNKIKAKEWQDIADKLNMQVDMVKKKWRNFRDNYARTVSKKGVTDQATDDDESLSKYSAQLKFLRPHLKHRPDPGSMDENGKIIESISERDVLWNPSNKYYKNSKIKAKEWQSVANNLNMPVDMVKKKWRNLRDNYARALSKKGFSDEVADDDECLGKYSVQLKFLRSYLRHKPTTSNNYQSTFEDEPSLSCSPLPSFSQNIAEQNNTLKNEANVDVYSSPPSSSRASSPTRKRKKNDIDETFISTMKTVQELLKKPRETAIVVQQPTQEKQVSEDDLFGQSLVQKLSKFPLRLKNQAKEEMLRYLNQLELNLLNETEGSQEMFREEKLGDDNLFI